MANTYAISLDRAAQQYLIANTNHGNAFSISGDFTFEIELNLLSFPAIDQEVYMIMAKFDNNGNNRAYQIFFIYNGTASKKEIHLKVSDDGIRTDEYVWQYNFLVSTCYRISITWSAAAAGVNAATLYVLDTAGNILYSASTTPSSNHGITGIFNAVANFVIGADSNGSGEALDANSVDDVRLWSAVLSQNTIQANALRELAGNEANLNAYWKLNNNYNDSTSNGNNFSPNGLPTFTTNVCFLDNTTTSTSTTSTSTSTTSTTTSTSTSLTTSTSSTTSTSTTSTSTSTTSTSTSMTSTSTSMTSTSTSTTSTSSSLTTSTSTSTSTTTTIDLMIVVEKIQ